MNDILVSARLIFGMFNSLYSVCVPSSFLTPLFRDEIRLFQCYLMVLCSFIVVNIFEFRTQKSGCYSHTHKHTGKYTKKERESATQTPTVN